jgi:hypothetical protein
MPVQLLSNDNKIQHRIADQFASDFEIAHAHERRRPPLESVV